MAPTSFRPTFAGPRQAMQGVNRMAINQGFMLPFQTPDLMPYTDLPGQVPSGGGGGGWSGFGTDPSRPRHKIVNTGMTGDMQPDKVAQTNWFNGAVAKRNAQQANAMPAGQPKPGDPLQPPMPQAFAPDLANAPDSVSPFGSKPDSAPPLLWHGGMIPPGTSAIVGDRPDGKPNKTSEMITALPGGGVTVTPNPATQTMMGLPHYAFGTTVPDVGDDPSGPTVDQKLMALSWMPPAKPSPGIIDFGGGNKALVSPYGTGSATQRLPGTVSANPADEKGTIDLPASIKAGSTQYVPDVLPAGHPWALPALPFDREANQASIAQDQADMQTGADYRRSLDFTNKVNTLAKVMPTTVPPQWLTPSQPATPPDANTILSQWNAERHANDPDPNNPFAFTPAQRLGAATEFQRLHNPNTMAGRQAIMQTMIGQNQARIKHANDLDKVDFTLRTKAAINNERFKPQIMDLPNGQQAINMGGRLHVLNTPVDKLSKAEIEDINLAGGKVIVHSDGKHTIEYAPTKPERPANERPIVHEMPTEPDANGVVGRKLVQWDAGTRQWKDAPMAPGTTAAEKPKPSSFLDSLKLWGK